MRKRGNMKKIMFILSVIFIVLTFAGAIYVLYNDGKAKAGYAVIPMVFAVASIESYRKSR